MASSKAEISPAVLVWARQTAGYSPSEAAKKLRVSVDTLERWETGADRPTIKQLRNIAASYKRPLSVFYLPEVPATFQVMRDLRRLPGFGLREYSPALTYEMRVAQQKRELAIELFEEINEAPSVFRQSANLEDDPETVGDEIRRALGVTHELQTTWGNPRVAFNSWRNHIESAGVLVFQITRVGTDEVSGFALARNVLPVIAVNRKDTFNRRTFSLLHEYAHLALRVSGASDLDVDAARPPEDARVEIFCNRAAAAALMPEGYFLAEAEIFGPRKAGTAWEDTNIESMALRYSVSREAVVRRLLTFGIVNESFYRRKRDQYIAELQARRAAEIENRSEKEFKKNPARDAILDSGRPFVELILNSYHQERITLSEASSYLGVRVKHVPRIEMTLGMG